MELECIIKKNGKLWWQGSYTGIILLLESVKVEYKEDGVVIIELHTKTPLVVDERIKDKIKISP